MPNHLHSIIALIFLITTKPLIVKDIAQEKPNAIDKLLVLAEHEAEINNEKSLSFAQEALRLSKNINYTKGKIKSWTLLANYHFNKNKLKLSLDYLDKASKLAIKENLEQEYGDVILVFIKIYSWLNQYERSLEMGNEALRIFKGIDNKKSEAATLGLIGHIYSDQGKIGQALNYYLKALNIAQNIDNNENIIKRYNDIAACYGIKKDYKNSEVYLKKALEKAKNNVYQIPVGHIYSNLGELKLETLNFDSAYYYFKQAKESYTNLKDKSSLVHINLQLGQYYSNINQKENALEHKKNALQLAKKENLKTSIVKAANHLSAFYLKEGDSLNAYKYSILQHKTEDLLNLENDDVSQFSHLGILNVYEKKNYENKLEQQSKNHKLQIWILIISLGSGMIIILLITRNKIKTQKAKVAKLELEETIATKNKELTYHVMTSIKRNKVITDVINQLNEAEIETENNPTKTKLKRITKQLKHTREVEIWKEFETRFKNVHKEFYDRLLERYPNITPAELRLCAFLRLNMTTKNISELTGQQVRSLEVARNRLRKKLGIDNTPTNLVTFISQI